MDIHPSLTPPVAVRRRHLWLLAILLSGGMCGCASGTLDYLVALGFGQLRVLVRAVPLDEVLADPNLDAETRDNLLCLQQVRQFAAEHIGLNAGRSYLKYYDTGDGPAIYNLSAAAKDAIEPVTWALPIVGEIQFLGYFQLEPAQQHAKNLQEMGYDTVIYGAIAYSTGGILPDPIYSALFRLDQIALAETVIHELTHNTIYRKSDSEFNESLATFVGRCGALEFFESSFGADNELHQRAAERFVDRQTVDQFLHDVLAELETFYARPDLTSEQKIQQRGEIFDAARQRFEQQILPTLQDQQWFSHYAEMPTNNAWILLNYRYTKDLDVFEQVYHQLGNDLAAAVDIFAQAANAPDAYQYMRDWLAAR